MSPLTPPMRHILARMSQGYTLGKDPAASTASHWLQLGGLGQGGPMELAHSASVRSLASRRHIRKSGSHPLGPFIAYELTARGRLAAPIHVSCDPGAGECGGCDGRSFRAYGCACKPCHGEKARKVP